MNESEWNTIYQNLSQKETDELIGYWHTHAEEEWTPIAFEVMEKILIERLGRLPDDVEIEKLVSEKQRRIQNKHNDSELKSLILVNDYEFYDPKKVTTLVKWIFRSAYVLIVLYIVQYVLNYLPLLSAIFNKRYKLSSLLYDLVLGLVSLLLVIIAVFIQYKALGYILKILKEMEINSRKSTK